MSSLHLVLLDERDNILMIISPIMRSCLTFSRPLLSTSSFSTFFSIFFWFSYFFPSHHHLTWDYEIHLHKNIIVVLSFHVIMTTHLLHPLIPSLSMSSTSLLNLVLFICCGKREILFRLHYLNIQTHTHTHSHSPDDRFEMCCWLH